METSSLKPGLTISVDSVAFMLTRLPQPIHFFFPQGPEKGRIHVWWEQKNPITLDKTEIQSKCQSCSGLSLFSCPTCYPHHSLSTSRTVSAPVSGDWWRSKPFRRWSLLLCDWLTHRTINCITCSQVLVCITSFKVTSAIWSEVNRKVS